LGEWRERGKKNVRFDVSELERMRESRTMKI
jgi:hypothetical protein